MVTGTPLRLSKSQIGPAEREAVDQVLKAEYLGMGREVGLFEEALSAYLGGAREVICVNSGTAALHLALQAAGIGPGDEVLVPTLTYAASFQAVGATGATPVACDVERTTGFLSYEDARRKLTTRTRAVMPVHYASHAPGLDAIYALAREHGLRVIEDAAHAFGCLNNGVPVGCRGDLVCFSFDGIKNITSGEGGAIVTGDREAASIVRDARLLGVERDSEMRLAGRRSWDFQIRRQGWRYHMSNIMAAIGHVQLQRIDRFRAVRQSIWHAYQEGLQNLEESVTLLHRFDASIHPHIVPIRVYGERRDGLREHLLRNGIECGIHYKPNHLLERFASGGCMNAEALYSELLSIPCHADMTPEQAGMVAETIRAFLR